MTYPQISLIIAIIALVISTFSLLRTPSETGMTASVSPPPLLANTSAEFNTEISGEKIREYLLNNPAVMAEVFETVQAWQNSQRQNNRMANIEAQRENLYNDGHSYVMGNPDGDVTIVEFFDYRCGFCKRALNDILETVSEDGNIRLVLKEYPVLGPQSDRAARAAVASLEQDGYLDFHIALMKSQGSLDDPQIFDIAGKSGLDITRLQNDMESTRVSDILSKNRALGQALGVDGTPSFIINDVLVPGAVGKQALQQQIRQVRQAS